MSDTPDRDPLAALLNARVQIWFCPNRKEHTPENNVRWSGGIATCEVCGATSKGSDHET